MGRVSHAQGESWALVFRGLQGLEEGVWDLGYARGEEGPGGHRVTKEGLGDTG